MVRVGGGHLAVDVVLVDLDRIASGVAERHHRAEGIEMVVVRAGVAARRFNHAE